MSHHPIRSTAKVLPMRASLKRMGPDGEKSPIVDLGFGAQSPKDFALDPTIRRFAINRWKAQLELCRIQCASLEREFMKPPTTAGEKGSLLLRWHDAIRDQEDALSMLEWLERDERESRGSQQHTC